MTGPAFDTGSIRAAYQSPLGATVTADVYPGATVITVDDVGDFDPGGGWVQIAGQVVQYIAVDDETGAITLAAPLT